MASLAARTANVGALLISDEVRGDLNHGGRIHPVAVDVAGDARDAVVTLSSIGKSFNCSGLAGSYLLVPHEAMRVSILAVLDEAGMHEGGLLATVAQDAALLEGRAWLDGLVELLVRNRDIVLDVVGEAAPDVVRHVPGASFLYWLDFSRLQIAPSELQNELLASTGLYLMDGRRFGPGGASHLRLNFAADETTITMAAHRIAHYVRSRN